MIIVNIKNNTLINLLSQNIFSKFVTSSIVNLSIYSKSFFKYLLLFPIILMLFCSIKAYASGDNTPPQSRNSCVNITPPSNLDLKSYKLYQLYQYFTVAYSGDNECGTPDYQIRFFYGGHPIKLREGEAWKNCNTNTSATTYNPLYSSVPAYFVAARNSDSLLCAYVWLPQKDGFIPITCKQAYPSSGNYKTHNNQSSPNPNQPKNNSNNTILHKCSEEVQTYSLFPINLSSKAVYCTKMLLSSLLNSSEKTDHSNVKLHVTDIQFQMKSVIFAALSLFIAFRAVKILMSPAEQMQAGQWLMFFWKYSLVLYFSVGVPVYSNQGIVYVGGIQTILIPLFEYGVDGFTMLIQSVVENFNTPSNSSGSLQNNLCVFSAEQYTPGFESLKIWDSLDCRILYYLGIHLDDHGRVNGLGGLWLIVASITSWYLILFVFVILMFAATLSLVVFFAAFYIICSTILVILIFLAPIMVPFALFEKTKYISTEWQKLILSYLLQPMIVMCFLGIFFGFADEAYYGSCEWQAVNTTTSPPAQQNDSFPAESCTNEVIFTLQNPEIYIPPIEPTSISKTIFKLKDGQDTSPSCSSTWGYLMHSGNLLHNIIGKAKSFFMTIEHGNVGNKIKDYLLSLISLALTLSILLKIADSIAEFAADITGGIDISRTTIGATAIFNKIKEATTNRIAANMNKNKD